MLERAHVQPELAALETLIRERVARLSAFEDERFARPARVERDPATGELTVLAEFITGSRLSDLLEATADAGIVPGVDVALGYLLDSLPALSLLHATGITHGLIDGSRTVLTPDGQVVFLDPVFGSAVERLNYSRQSLWTRFGVASPSGEGTVHFDAAADVAQVALGAVALVLGRNLKPDEYPEALPSLLMEVIEVAQIRGSAAFATGFQRFLQRSLPIPGRRAYASADEAVADVRQLVRRDIGADVCRQAVVDFAVQMDAAFAAAPADSDEVAAADDGSTHQKSTSDSPKVPELDTFLDRFDHSTDIDTATAAAAPPQTPSATSADDELVETELSLDDLDSDAPVAATRPPARKPANETDEIYELPPLDDVLAVKTLLAPTTPPAAPSYRQPEPPAQPPPVREAAQWTDVAAVITTDATALHAIEFARAIEAIGSPEKPVPTPPVEPEPKVWAPAVPVPAPVVEPQAPLLPSAESAAAEAEPEHEHEKDSASSRRRKRQQQKSARARKDKLRSTTAGQKSPPPPPVPEPPRPSSPTGWLVSPQRAAQFEPPVPVPHPIPVPVLAAPPPARPAPVAMPALPSFVPTPVSAVPQPMYPSSAASASAYGTPSVPQPVRPGPLAPPPIQPAPQLTAQVKVKAEPPSGFAPRRSPIAEPAVVHMPDRFGTLGLGRSDSAAGDEPRSFPWKLAAVAVGVAIIAAVVGRTYLPGRTAVTGEPGAPVDSPAAANPAPAPAIEDDSPIPSGRGRLVVVTQPPGIKVLIDRKPVGETPLSLDVTPGRRILTFLTNGGEVIRSVRVPAGRTETVDIPVFSGWVAVFAPIVLSVAADGKNIGTTEDSRLMLPPGKHQLTLSNRELGYTSTQEVEIEPGEVKSVNVDPRGTVNLNAVPWAEVWLDGQKLGDTPLAETPVPLGTREFVFKNPQFGERKVSATIKASANAPVAVDFTK